MTKIYRIDNDEIILDFNPPIILEEISSEHSKIHIGNVIQDIYHTKSDNFKSMWKDIEDELWIFWNDYVNTNDSLTENAKILADEFKKITQERKKNDNINPKI
jgi:hypothetical protein